MAEKPVYSPPPSGEIHVERGSVILPTNAPTNQFLAQVVNQGSQQGSQSSASSASNSGGQNGSNGSQSS